MLALCREHVRTTRREACTTGACNKCRRRAPRYGRQEGTVVAFAIGASSCVQVWPRPSLDGMTSLPESGLPETGRTARTWQTRWRATSEPGPPEASCFHLLPLRSQRPGGKLVLDGEG